MRTDKQQESTEKTRLSHNERREYRQLEKEIAQLEEEKSELEAQISSGTLGHEELQKKSAAYAELSETLEAKTERWFELAEVASD